MNEINLSTDTETYTITLQDCHRSLSINDWITCVGDADLPKSM